MFGPQRKELSTQPVITREESGCVSTPVIHFESRQAFIDIAGGVSIFDACPQQITERIVPGSDVALRSSNEYLMTDLNGTGIAAPIK